MYYCTRGKTLLELHSRAAGAPHRERKRELKMISWKDLYTVLSAVVPLYVAMMLAYGSVKWWRIFSPDQCAGINRFVAVFAVPLLSFHFISSNNIYAMNYRFIAADSLQKVLILTALGIWVRLGRGSVEWMITLFSLSTLPNTLVMGIPLLKAMYGDRNGQLMVQVVVMQSVVWYTLMLFMFEYRGAKLLIVEQFPGVAAASIVSFRVDSDVVSLDGRDSLLADAELGHDGKLHVTVRKSTSSRSVRLHNNTTNLTPRPSNLTGVEIYSLSSSRNPTPRGSSFNHSDFYSMLANANRNPSPRQSSFQNNDVCSRGATPRTSNFDDDGSNKLQRWPARPHSRTISGGCAVGEAVAPYPSPNAGMVSPAEIRKSGSHGVEGVARSPNAGTAAGECNSSCGNNKELHMFVWSSSASPVSEANQVFGAGVHDIVRSHTPDHPIKGFHEATASYDESAGGAGAMTKRKASEDFGSRDLEASVATSPMNSKLDYNKSSSVNTGAVVTVEEPPGAMPPASVMTRLILIMVWRKLIRNPNTYSSVLGLAWSLISFRFNVAMPKIIHGSISILSDAGLGMAMFSLGLFMALQPKIIACGKSVAAFAMAVRFLTGPAVMAAASIAIGLRNTLLHVAIVQAALPQGIVPFVFAKEYGVHPEILSTAVIFGMLIALPITLLYYVLLGL